MKVDVQFWGCGLLWRIEYIVSLKQDVLLQVALLPKVVVHQAT
jgi:hypothetical protein